MSKWILATGATLFMAALVPAGVGAPAFGASKARHCKVDHLAAIDKRLHVKCAAGQEA